MVTNLENNGLTVKRHCFNALLSKICRHPHSNSREAHWINKLITASPIQCPAYNLSKQLKFKLFPDRIKITLLVSISTLRHWLTQNLVKESCLSSIFIKLKGNKLKTHFKKVLILISFRIWGSNFLCVCKIWQCIILITLIMYWVWIAISCLPFLQELAEGQTVIIFNLKVNQNIDLLIC